MIQSQRGFFHHCSYFVLCANHVSYLFLSENQRLYIHFFSRKMSIWLFYNVQYFAKLYLNIFIFNTDRCIFRNYVPMDRNMERLFLFIGTCTWNGLIKHISPDYGTVIVWLAVVRTDYHIIQNSSIISASVSIENTKLLYTLKFYCFTIDFLAQRP